MISAKPASDNSSAKLASDSRNAQNFLAALAKAGAALKWRQGDWLVLTANGAPGPTISRRRHGMIAALVEQGHLRECDDGTYRPRDDVVGAPVINSHESPIGRLAHVRRDDGKAYFDAEQLRAGERLRRDFERAQLAPSVTMNYASGEGGGGRHWQMSDNAIEKITASALVARDLVHAAMTSVGPELAGILFHVCCMVAGLEEAERHMALPRRSGKAVLGLALTRLARHYGLLPELKHGGPSRLGHWAMPGTRATIPPPLHQP